MEIKSLSGTAIAAIAIAVFVGIMLISANELKPQLDNPTFIIKEGELNKTTKLKISSGERYSYVYKFRNASANMTYIVVDGGPCTIIQMLQGDVYVCVDKFGNDKAGQNSTFSTPAIVLLKPWMLAVDENWEWKVSSYMVFDSIKKHVKDMNYTTVRKEYYKGREVYVVRMSDSDGDEVWTWVDAEKRIMLREFSTSYEIILVSGLKLE